MALELQAANLIPNQENEVLHDKLVAQKASDEDITSCIVKDRENNRRFVFTVRGIFGKITDNTQINRHSGTPKL